MADSAGIREDARVLCLTTICFDIFVMEALLPLTKGAVVILGNENEQADPYAYREWKAAEEILKKTENGSNQVFQKIPLPTYAFRRESCWNKETYPAMNLRPMLHGTLLETNGQLLYTYAFKKEDWVIGEHLFGGKCILPGTAYIEIISELFEQQFRTSRPLITNLVYLTPFIVEGSEERVLLNLAYGKDNYKFTASSKDETGGFVVHAEGFAEELKEAGIWAGGKIPIGPGDGFIKSIEPENSMLELGSHWNAIHKQAFQKENRYIAHFKMPDGAGNAYLFQPALLDRSINAAIGYINRNADYLPYLCRRLKLYQPLPDELLSITDVLDDKNGETVVSKVVLCGMDGIVYTEADGYAVKRAYAGGMLSKPYTVAWKQLLKRKEAKWMSGSNAVLLIGTKKEAEGIKENLDAEYRLNFFLLEDEMDGGTAEKKGMRQRLIWRSMEYILFYMWEQRCMKGTAWRFLRFGTAGIRSLILCSVS